MRDHRLLPEGSGEETARTRDEMQDITEAMRRAAPGFVTSAEKARRRRARAAAKAARKANR